MLPRPNGKKGRSIMEENKQNVTDVKPETEENKPQSDLEG